MTDIVITPPDTSRNALFGCILSSTITYPTTDRDKYPSGDSALTIAIADNGDIALTDRCNDLKLPPAIFDTVVKIVSMLRAT